ncbi:MAG: DNA mismatch repair protein MutS, partial [Vulcanimicrobiaceae bacterium]
EPLRGSLPPAFASSGAALAAFDALADDLATTLADELPASLADGGAIRPEASSELAECVALRSSARERIASLEARERTRTGIKNLKVKYANPFGYAFEVSKGQLALVPPEYVRRQTLAAAERFITPELRELELAIAGAETQAQRLETALYANLVERVAAVATALAAAADALAEIDVSAALAQVAGERGYARPEFAEESVLEIADGRHPVIEALGGDGFVPNDLHLGLECGRFIVLTGPNMGGKSTFLRQAALLVILAQIGSYVPARAMRLGIVERIFTRIGAGDDLASGQSTFFVEMSEAAQVLRRTTRRSLVLVDELGRGTGTVDGLAIAQAICEHLLRLSERLPMVLFATHFHELVALVDAHPSVANFHVTAVENLARSGAPVFSHRVLAGSTSRSFGVEVAKMAGLPNDVIARAKELASALAERPGLERAVPAPPRNARSDSDRDPDEPQLPLGF